jgi:aspartyl-tRNA(Asn)/glutamyl-tRNA(Gln) amidotransferase subunit A
MAKYSNLASVQQAIREGQTSCKALVQYYLEQIEEHQDLNVYLEVFDQEALEKAEALDKKIQHAPEELGKLWGMIVSIKDVICYKEHKVSAGSKILEDFESLFSATAVERILAEDAIIIGRTNCDEFAMGSSNENSAFGPVLNGTDPERIPGGSSGGAAVSVQMDTCLAALGTDTGGSVRQPAALCGILGMKPSYGRISRYGLVAYGSSFDQVGIFAHTTEDIALLLEIMAGADRQDATSSQRAVPAYSKMLDYQEQPSIAYYRSALEHPALDPEIRALMEQQIDNFRQAGYRVEGVEFQYLDYIVPAYYVLTTAEASSNLSRYDGVRYGYRDTEASSLDDLYTHSRTQGFGEEVKRRIMLGTFVLSAGYYDAYYTKAQKVRRLIAEETRQLLSDFDFLLMPTTPAPAWKLGEKTDDPVEMYLADIFTVQANMAGIPGIAFPVGKTRDGLSVGLQLMSNVFEEAKLLGFVKKLLSN